KVMAEVKTLYNVVVFGIVLGTTLPNFVLKRIRHVHALVEMREDSILNKFLLDFYHHFLKMRK
uniref:hypothetical protein n=1 Tax=Acinetobacter baumannii TaxID=470 RepID=UPI0033926E88